MQIIFRRAAEKDKPFLLRLRKVSMTEHLKNAGIEYSDEQHMARVNEYFNDSYILVAEQRALGLVKLGQFSDRLHIRQLQLLPEYQNKGIGAKVLEIIQGKAQQHKLDVTLNVLFDNPAKDLYLRKGFIIEGENSLEYQMRWPREH